MRRSIPEAKTHRRTMTCRQCPGQQQNRQHWNQQRSWNQGVSGERDEEDQDVISTRIVGVWSAVDKPGRSVVGVSWMAKAKI